MGEDVRVTVPSVGESVSEGVIANWLVADGQSIEEGSPLFELETDKATLDVPAPASGVVKIEASKGSEVSIGQQVAIISPATAPTSNSLSDSTLSDIKTKDTESQSVESEGVDGSASPSSAATSASHDTRSPAVRRIAAEHSIDAGQVIPTGKGGRVTKGDMLNALKEREDKGKDAPASEGPPAASPARDVAAPFSKPQERVDVAGAPTDGAQHTVPMSRIRQRIAENLVRSTQNAAHLTTFNEIDMTEVMELRAMYKEEFEAAHDIRIGFMSFFITATCHALQKFPTIHAFLVGSAIVYNHGCHIGVALASDRGLIVPVIRNAEQKGFAQLEQEIKEFARAAKEKRLSPDALQGGTFTITNGGIFGSLLSTPIPNPPQTAILGMHAIQKRPAVVGDSVVSRPLMYVALTYDHRLIDGREAVSFLRSIKESIEAPARLMLNL